MIGNRRSAEFPGEFREFRPATGALGCPLGLLYCGEFLASGERKESNMECERKLRQFSLRLRQDDIRRVETLANRLPFTRGHIGREIFLIGLKAVEDGLGTREFSSLADFMT